jgi:hypothetical protein
MRACMMDYPPTLQAVLEDNRPPRLPLEFAPPSHHTNL